VGAKRREISTTAFSSLRQIYKIGEKGKDSRKENVKGGERKWYVSEENKKKYVLLQKDIMAFFSVKIQMVW
jgi:hypothetical protein